MLTISPTSDDLRRGLESWNWIELSGLQPVLVGALGDVFFLSSDGIVMLDTVDGQLVRVADDVDQFRALLQTEEGQDRLLMAGLILAAQRDRGLSLAEGQCFDFRIMPALGGEISVDALEVTSFVVKLNIAGQLHKQIKDRPPGTPIGKIEVVDV